MKLKKFIIAFPDLWWVQDVARIAGVKLSGPKILLVKRLVEFLKQEPQPSDDSASAIPTIKILLEVM